jgi:hypothetical protein
MMGDWGLDSSGSGSCGYSSEWLPKILDISWAAEQRTASQGLGSMDSVYNIT